MRSRLYLALLILIAPLVGHAGLGGHVDSIADDRQAMKGLAQKAQTLENYTVHEMTTDACTVREYVNADGTIFAVTWRGVGRPDLKTLLGDFYDEFTVQDAATASEGKHAPRNIESRNVVVRRSGHMRDWRGRAFAPKFIPEGVNVEVLP